MKLLRSSLAAFIATLAGCMLVGQARAADREDAADHHVERPEPRPAQNADTRTNRGLAPAREAKPSNGAKASNGSTDALKAYLKAHAQPAAARAGHSVTSMANGTNAHIQAHQPAKSVPHVPAPVRYGSTQTGNKGVSAPGGPRGTSAVVGGLPSTKTLSKAARIDGTAMRRPF
jgi:hypothetical protein